MKTRLLAAFLVLASPAQADDLRLGLPLACTIGETCWVQQYFDRDPGPGATDYACGSETYDGHDGIDFRLRDTAAEAPVLATAAGVVKATRDGVADHLVKTAADRAATAKRECGNGVVIDHGNGWETQYCHLRQGTVSVHKGAVVKAGDPLGKVGFSGLAAFPHVHLTVRRDGVALDPFRPSKGPACAAAGALWTPAAAALLSYHQGDILRAGFSSVAPTLEDLETGVISSTNALDRTAPALLFYLWAINLQTGDVISISISGPAGFAAENRIVLDHAKAQYLAFAGRKSAKGLSAGPYTGSYSIERAGKIYLEQEQLLTLE